MPSSYNSTTADVITVLQSWANEYDGKDEWRSLLNKSNLRHEVEESIVALHHLREWTTASIAASTDGKSNPFIAVDACCGKGVFSMLLSYMAPRHYPGLSRVILLDKNQNINWDHIQAANDNHKQEKRPVLELWAGTNLHEHDIMTERLLLATTANANNEPAAPLAITGIHLCKTLSPTLVGIVNALGKENVPYLCLAPCCLPRRQNLELPIYLYEAPLQRHARLLAAKAKKQQTFRCFVCQGHHHVRNCPERATYATESEWDQAVTDGILRLPCHKCGKVGHRQADCTESAAVVQAPRMLWDLSTAATSDTNKPSPCFETYCDALSKTLQQTSTVQVMDSGLISSSCTSSHAKQHENNWNQNRKSLFIVATR